MTSIETVAAVIVSWQTPEMTRSLLAHLVSHWPGMDVFLVECGSETHEPTPPGVTVLRTGNLGYAGGNNAGINAALAAGKQYILVLNSDAVPLPGSIESLVDVLESDATIAACGATLVAWTDDGVKLNAGTAFDWGRGETKPVHASSASSAVEFACGAAILLRRQSVENVGGFDSNLFLYYEDLDWAERARRAGGSVHVSREARVLHNGSVSTKRASKAAAFFRSRNRLWVLRRYGALHGHPLSLPREAVHVIRVLLSETFSGDLSLLIPRVIGTALGVTGTLPAVTDEPRIGLTQWCFELKQPTRWYRRRGRRNDGAQIHAGTASHRERRCRASHR